MKNPLTFWETVFAVYLGASIVIFSAFLAVFLSYTRRSYWTLQPLPQNAGHELYCRNQAYRLANTVDQKVFMVSGPENLYQICLNEESGT